MFAVRQAVPVSSLLRSSLRSLTYTKKPVRVAVTGASGQIGYSLLFRIASGDMLGKDQPVELQLLELPQAMKSVEGVIMELNDCAFPLLSKVYATDDAERAFEGAQVALLVGAKPRGPGMERADLLKENAKIFVKQGAALNNQADRENLRCLVVGNPANTNAWIAAHSAPKIHASRFHAMTRLDHNRALAQLSAKLNVPVTAFDKFVLWGNHSSTQFPDISYATVNGKNVRDLVDNEWYVKTFIPTVQKRGAAIIAARGLSSAASAASSAIDHVRDWFHGSDGKWTSFSVPSDGSYGTTPGLVFSFPVVVDKSGKYSIVQGLPINDFARKSIDATNNELAQENADVLKFL